MLEDGGRRYWSGNLRGAVSKMLSEKMYTDEYIRGLQTRTGNDPALLERVIYAFSLLEAIRRVELPFCFKGGTNTDFFKMPSVMTH